MLDIQNAGVKEFKEKCKGKKVYYFGAGGILHNCVDMYGDAVKPVAIIDNDKNKWGQKVAVGEDSFSIVAVDELVNEVLRDGKENVTLLITSTFYAKEIVEQLDTIVELDGLETYIHSLIRNVKEEAPVFEFTKGEQKIPKIIHYFWIGGNPIPENLQQCIDTWKKFNPDYEVICWDESNYDFTKNAYMKEAYQNKVWGFVTDIARLDVVYQYGGIYLDTDVEVVKNLDVLLNDEAFFGMGSADRIATGVGFGSIKRNLLIKELRDYYENIHFERPDGSLNRTPCYYYQHPVLKKYGFKIINEYQKIGNVVVYPSEVLSPKGTMRMGDFFSDKTVAIHHGEGSWNTSKERNSVVILKEFLKERH